MRIPNTSIHRFSAFGFGICSVVLWVVWAAWLNGAQPGDNLEQLLWSREWAWGYAKHPPMSTWLLIGVQSLLGRSPYWTYLLAALCHTITLMCMYRIACELLDPESSVWVVLILAMTYAMTRKAQYYNHNTVLLMGLSLTTWLTLLALKRQRWWIWISLGIALGGLLLTKYQSLIGVALVYLILLRQSQQRHWAGWTAATLVMGMAVAPHAAWLLSLQPGHTPLTYAQNYAQLASGLESVKGLVSFTLGLIKQYAQMALFLLGILVWRLWRTPQTPPVQPAPLNALATSVILHMTLTRAVIMGVIGLVGVRLQDHWAMPLALFLALPLARFVRQRLGAVTVGQLQWWIAVQLLALGFFTLQHQGFLSNRNLEHIERHLSVSNLVTQVEHRWRSRTQCPLLVVEGAPELTTLLVGYSSTVLWRADADPKSAAHPTNPALANAGRIRLEFVDQGTSSNSMFDDLMEVPAYVPLKGLPDRTVQVGFIFPQAPCPR